MTLTLALALALAPDPTFLTQVSMKIMSRWLVTLRYIMKLAHFKMFMLHSEGAADHHCALSISLIAKNWQQIVGNQALLR